MRAQPLLPKLWPWLPAVFLLACYRQETRAFPDFDALKQARPAAPRKVSGVLVSEADYQRILRWGADWFRSETFGGERMITDVVGFLNAPIQVPCATSEPKRRDCFETHSSVPYFARAIDALDGVPNNLYSGNGGFEGSGSTHDLVIRFPPGSRMHGLPLPEAVHTGLDVEAGSAWPIGIVPVEVAPKDARLPYIWDLGALGVGPAPAAKNVRIGIACALCHYSLDVDWDGISDLKSADIDRPTPGSAYRPEHSWAIGNQDLKVGWLFAMSQNPLVGFSIFSGPIGVSDDDGAALRWVQWVKDNYRRAPETVTREVVRGMLLQPRGYADVSSNARYNASQFPPLYTQDYWPSNSDGAVLNGLDRNSVVWTSTMDFSGLVSLSGDRGSSASGGLYWEKKSIYNAFTARELAELMVYLSPGGRGDPARRDALRDDILGASDGVPGMLDPDSVYVMPGPPGVMPESLLNHPKNVAAGRIRRAADYAGNYPGDALNRGPTLALLGIRTHTRPHIAKEIGLAELVKRYPGLSADDFMGEAVNVSLDWQPSPPNQSRRLARASHLVARGYDVFKSEGCSVCHRGPFFTDNLIHRFSARRSDEIGIAPPSTAGFRSLGRGSGPAIGSDPNRTEDSRPLYLYVAPSYDPRTGVAVAQGSPLRGLFGNQVVGYKTTQLRYVWGSAPYLHDGGVGVAIAPGTELDHDDLAAVLRLPDARKLFGMSQILARQETAPEAWLRPDAALSLQALLLRSERARMLAHASDRVIPVPGVGSAENPLGSPAFVSARELGIAGVGHEFYVDDVPGGERVSALIAFLLSLDDAPGELPSEVP
jgi:hypothetical protein